MDACQNAAGLVEFIGGIGAFYLIRGLNPDLDLGAVSEDLNFVFPLSSLDNVETWKSVARYASDILPMSLILAVVATIGFIASVSCCQNVSDLHFPLSATCLRRALLIVHPRLVAA